MTSGAESDWQDGTQLASGRERIVPPPGGVHLWMLRTSPDWVKELLPEERRRYSGIANPGVRNDYAAAQAGLRRVLSIYRKEAPGGVVIRREPRGKPYVVGGPEFNLSHTAGGVLVAVSAEPVGLDVESRDRKVHGTGLARKFFSEVEIEELESFSGGVCDAAFIRRWVCKEAMVKLSGEGIFLGLREALTSRDESGGMTGKYRGRRVCLREIFPRPNLRAALATWKRSEVKGFFRL